MSKKLSSKILAPVMLVVLALSMLFFSTPASAAGISEQPVGDSWHGPAVAYYGITIDNPNLIPDLKSGKLKRENLWIFYSDDIHVISNELVEALKISGINSLSFRFEFEEVDGYSNFIVWHFPSNYPLEKLVNFDLAVKAKVPNQVTDSNYTSIANVVKNDQAIFLEFAYSGELAAPVEITYANSKPFDGKNINVYYCPPNSTSAELVAKDIQYIPAYFINYTFELTHMSTYMLKVGEYTVPQATIVNNDATNNNNNKSSSKDSSSGSTLSGNAANSSAETTTSGVNPSTGSADGLMVPLGGLLLASCSALVALRKKK